MRWRASTARLVADVSTRKIFLTLSGVLESPPAAVLVVDGLFPHRDELAGVWEMSVFLQVPFAVSVARMAARDGSHPDPTHASMVRYVEGQQRYFDACRPWERADLVVDVTDLDAPTLIEAR